MKIKGYCIEDEVLQKAKDLIESGLPFSVDDLRQIYRKYTPGRGMHYIDYHYVLMNFPSRVIKPYKNKSLLDPVEGAFMWKFKK